MLLASMAVSVLLQGGMQAADYESARIAMRRPGIQEGALGNQAALKAALGVGLALADHQAEKEMGKKVWIFRAVEIVGYGLVVRHNLRIARP
jgi:hypothetical protein